MKKVLITGSSRGLGKALAEEYTKRGYKVIAGARNPDDVDIKGLYQKVRLDITDPKTVDDVISKIGEIDILINNAGVAISGPVEAIPINEAKYLFETNFWGSVRMMQAVIPAMRAKGNGLIVNISSAASQFATPYGSYYSASKAALEMVSEELRFELKRFGIEVMVMQCGAIDTDISTRHERFVHNAYAELDRQIMKGFDEYKKQNNRPSANSIAIQIIEAAEAEGRPFKTIIGKDAAYMIDMRKKMSDDEWEKQSPLTRNLIW